MYPSKTALVLVNENSSQSFSQKKKKYLSPYNKQLLTFYKSYLEISNYVS